MTTDKPEEGAPSAPRSPLDALHGQSFGQWLRAQREAKNIPIEDIATATKIHAGQLKSIEADEKEKFPPPAFMRGFLVSYSRYLTLDEDQVLLLYKASHQQTDGMVDRPTPSGSRAARSSTHPKVNIVGSQQLSRAAPGSQEEESSILQWFTVRNVSIIVGLVVVIVLGVYLIRLGRKQVQEAPVAATPAPVETLPADFRVPLVLPPVAGAAAPAPVAAAPVPAPQAPVAAAPVPPPADAVPANSKHRLELKALEQTWVNVKIDDGDSKGIMMKPGAISMYGAMRKIQIALSNAGGVEIRWDGMWYSPPGFRGDVTALTLPEQLPTLKKKGVVTPPPAAAVKPAAPMAAPAAAQ